MRTPHHHSAGLVSSAVALLASAAVLVQAQDDGSDYGSDDGSGSDSGSGSGYVDPDADPALLDGGVITVSTPPADLTACDDRPLLHWRWSGNQVAAYYHRIDMYAFSTTLGSPIDPTALEATLKAGGDLPQGLTLITPTRGVRLSEQEYRWRSLNVPAGAYTLYVILRDRPTTFGQSPVFTVSEGDDTSCIRTTSPVPSLTGSPAQPTSTPDSGSGNDNNSASSGGSSSGGTIAAAVIVPLVVILAAIAAFIFYRRRKRAQQNGGPTALYANVSSPAKGGRRGGAGAAGSASAEKQEEMLPIAHAVSSRRDFQTPSPMEQRNVGSKPTGWASMFSFGAPRSTAPTSTGGGASAATAAAAAAGGAAIAAANEKKTSSPPAQPTTTTLDAEPASPVRSPPEYGAQASNLHARSTSALQGDNDADTDLDADAFNDIHAAVINTAPTSEAHSSPGIVAPSPAGPTVDSSNDTPAARRPIIPALSGWYLGKEAQQEVPSLPPAVSDIGHTDDDGHEVASPLEADDDDEDERNNSMPEPEPSVPDLPAGSTTAAIAAAAAAPRTYSVPASPRMGQQQQLQQPLSTGQSPSPPQYGNASRPPSAYNNLNAPASLSSTTTTTALGMGQPSASTSTSSLRGPAPPPGQHRRTNSGFAGVGAAYAGSSPDGRATPVHYHHEQYAPPPPTAALMAGPPAPHSYSHMMPGPGAFPVGVSFQPGQIVSFGGGGGLGANSRSMGSMAGVGARAGAGAGGAPPPSAYHTAAQAQAQQLPPRSPTPTRMAGPRSTTPLGFVPAGGVQGRYPSWYGGAPQGGGGGAGTEDGGVSGQQQQQTASSGSDASSPGPFADQNRTRI
ncbi:hypothetical protein V8E36_006606 [Tilletia maclaganii]